MIVITAIMITTIIITIIINAALLFEYMHYNSISIGMCISMYRCIDVERERFADYSMLYHIIS